MLGDMLFLVYFPNSSKFNFAQTACFFIEMTFPIFFFVWFCLQRPPKTCTKQICLCLTVDGWSQPFFILLSNAGTKRFHIKRASYQSCIFHYQNLITCVFRWIKIILLMNLCISSFVRWHCIDSVCGKRVCFQ